jgi:exoribonuclease R
MSMTIDKTNSQVVVDLFAQATGFKPLFAIARALNKSPGDARRMVEAGVRAGRLVKTLFDNVGLADELTILEGVISANAKGFGFVMTEDEVSRFVPPPQMKGLITGDVVRRMAASRQKSCHSLAGRRHSGWARSRIFWAVKCCSPLMSR